MSRVCLVVVFILLVSVNASSQSTDIERRVDSILSQLTLEEKLDLLGGVDGFFSNVEPFGSRSSIRFADAGIIGVIAP